MSQSRAASLLEAAANVVAGWCLALVLTVAVLPVFGLHPSLAQSVRISLVFTAASIARSYLLRRIFERASRTGPVPSTSIDAGR